MFNVAIDGPGGAGKSSTARALAKELGLCYVDTGAIYRGLGVYLTRRGVNVSEEKEVEAALGQLECSVSYEDGVQQISVNGENVTPFIRTPEASDAASRVAVHPCVREKLLSIQRELGERFEVIMDGRDIGTVVLPGAAVKLFITASPEVRGKRRFLELREKGDTSVTLEEVTEDIKKRDERDSNRKIAPLKQAADAVLVDTSEMNFDEVCAFVASLIEKARKEYYAAH